MKKFILETLTALLEPWFVPREDYQWIQGVRWSLEQYADRLQQDYVDLMDSYYSRSFQQLEEYGQDIKAEYVETERIDLREMLYSYHFRIPNKRFVTLIDLTRLHKNVKQETIARLTKAFEKHMQQNLFRDL